MKRLGIGKKGDGDDDSNRSALFGSRSKNKSPSPAANPYAQPAGPPDPYTQAKMNAGVAPLRGGTPDNAPPRYSGPPGQGYGNDNKYGSDNKYGPPQGGYGGGYGGDRYGGGGDVLLFHKSNLLLCSGHVLLFFLFRRQLSVLVSTIPLTRAIAVSTRLAIGVASIGRRSTL